MMLTDAQKEEARRLGLTQEEARFSLATRITLARYAEVKAEIAAEADAWDAKVEAMGAALTDHLRYAVRRPDAAADGSAPEDGG